MKYLFNSIRTLCLVAVMCMVSANALAYDVYDPDDNNINVNPEFLPCKILVVEEDATVDNCNVDKGGVLIIKEGKTVTVTTNFNCQNSTIYVYGTLNIVQAAIIHNINRSTVYIMQGGSLVGSYNSWQSTISTNVDPATVGSFGKVDAQVPTPANSFVGWPDYYQQRIYSADETDFYPLANYDDAAHTQPIVDFDAWKTNYSNTYHAGYDAGAAATLGSMGEPCTDCPSIEVTKGDKSVKLYQPDKVEFIMESEAK